MANFSSSCKQDQIFWELVPGFSGSLWVSSRLALAQDIALCRNKAGHLPGAWAQLVAALLLLTVAFSLAVRQLCSSGASPGALGAGAPPASEHSHRPGVYHHGAIISPAGQC